METITCKVCDKVIEGFTTKQVDYLLAAHIAAKHKKE